MDLRTRQFASATLRRYIVQRRLLSTVLVTQPIFVLSRVAARACGALVADPQLLTSAGLSWDNR
jgi:hypothetical protein